MTLIKFVWINTIKRLPNIPLNTYIKLYFKVPIKYSTIVPKNNIPNEFEKRCSKFPCKTLFAIHLYDSKKDSRILVPHRLPNISKVLIEGGRNLTPFWEGSNPFGINEIINTIKLINRITNENELKEKKGHITSLR